MLKDCYPSLEMFSVVIPAKNEEDFIEIILDKINTQTIKPNEVIVADKSTDNTAQIAKRMGAKVVEGTDDGFVGKARNRGAMIVQTDLIIFLDADTYPQSDTLFEDLLKEFNRKKLDIATCYYKPDIKNVKTVSSFFVINMFKRYGSLTQKIIADGAGCLIIKKDVFKDLGGFSETLRLGEDTDLMRRALKKGYRFGTLPEKVITSARRFNKTYLNLLRIIIGCIGLGLTYVLSQRIYKPNHKKYEDLYGQTGGTSKDSDK